MDRQNQAKMAQPKLADLMTRFLNQQAQDRQAGLPEMPVGEVELHEAALRMGVNLFVYAVTSRPTP